MRDLTVLESFYHLSEIWLIFYIPDFKFNTVYLIANLKFRENFIDQKSLDLKKQQEIDPISVVIWHMTYFSPYGPQTKTPFRNHSCLSGTIYLAV